MYVLLSNLVLGWLLKYIRSMAEAAFAVTSIFLQVRWNECAVLDGSSDMLLGDGNMRRSRWVRGSGLGLCFADGVCVCSFECCL